MRESDDGHLCGKCGETTFLDQCACDLLAQAITDGKFERMLERAQEVLAERERQMAHALADVLVFPRSGFFTR